MGRNKIVFAPAGLTLRLAPLLLNLRFMIVLAFEVSGRGTKFAQITPAERVQCRVRRSPRDVMTTTTSWTWDVLNSTIQPGASDGNLTFGNSSTVCLL
jgi:hypothetical protein